MGDTKEEAKIDLFRIVQIISHRKKKVVLLCIVGFVIGFVYAIMQPPIFSSTIMIQVNQAETVANLSDSISMANRNECLSAKSVVELIKSPTVIEATVDSMSSDAVERERLSSTLSRNLKASDITGTNFVSITCQGNTPQEAKSLAQGIVENYMKIDNESYQEHQKRKADFLANKVSEAEKAISDVEDKLIAVPHNENNPIYRQLQLEKKVKEEIYVALVKEQESSGIREHFNAEKVRIVSPANLPVSDIGPRSRKIKYAVAGLVAGILVSLLYGLVRFWTEKRTEKRKEK